MLKLNLKISSFLLITVLNLSCVIPAIAQQGPKAEEIRVNTANLDNNLSASDSDLQTALETIDELIISGGSGDVTGVGDCASGACGDGTSDGGTYYRFYDGNSHYLQLGTADRASNQIINFGTMTDQKVCDYTATGTLINCDVDAVLDSDIGTTVQAFDADLSTYAGITPSANVQSILDAANYAAIRTLLDLEAGTDFYSISAADTAFVNASGGDTMAPKLTISDSASTPPLNVTERSAAPSSPSANDIYLDDGTNTASGNPGWRRYTGAGWEDLNEESGGAGDVTAWGDCASGACGDGTSDGGTTFALYDGDSHKADFAVANLDGNRTYTFGNLSLTFDQSVASGAAPTFTADNFSDGGSNAIITTTQETNFETAYTHSQDNTQAHSDYLLNSADDTTAGSIAFATGKGIQTGTTATNTLLLQAYDNDTGPGYVTFGTLTAGNTPTMDLSSSVTAGGSPLLVDSDIGSTVQAYDADLDTYAGITPSANVQSILAAANYAAIRGLLDLEAGTDFYSISAADAAFQPLDSELTTIAGLTETNGAVMFVAGGVWTADTTPAIDCTDCTNIPAADENTVEGFIFDSDAETVTGTWEWQDNVYAVFGNDADFHIGYDAAGDARLEITDGTNLLLSLTDNTNEGDLTVTGDLAADNLSGTNTGDEDLASIQALVSNDFHNLGGTDDDVPESGDFGAAADLESDGSLSADVVAAAEMADADHGDVAWSGGVATVVSASNTEAGKIEIATAAETTTGTDNTRSVSPDGLAGSDFGKRILGTLIFGSGTAVSTGNGTSGIPITVELNGYNVVDVQCNVYTKGVTGTTTIVLRKQRGATDSDVTSTGITLGDEYYASDEIIDTGADDLATGDMLFWDVDTIHSGTAPNGLSCMAVVQLP